MAFWAHILRCSDGRYYTGHTDNLEQRFAQHQSGLVQGYTALRLPVTLFWSLDFPSRYEALEAELTIKKWSRAKKEALARGDWADVSFFAKPPRERELRTDDVSTSLDTNGVEGAFTIPFVSSEVETSPTCHARKTDQ